jgi:hypothetical protein
MQANAKFLGTVHVWKDGDVCRWSPLSSDHAPENAIEAEHYRGEDGKDVLYVDYGDSGQFYYDAVKADWARLTRQPWGYSRGMLVVYGSLFIVSGVVLILFARQIAGVFIHLNRRMGGESSVPDPMLLFSVAYMAIGVIQIGLGAVLLYKGLRPWPASRGGYTSAMDTDATKKRIVMTLLAYGVAVVVGYYLITLVFAAWLAGP